MSRSSQRQAGRLGGLSVLSAVVLGLALGAGSAPAQASEVVKLARLLLTGKRAPSPPPAAPQPAPTESRNAEPGSAQSRAADSSPELHAMTRRGGEPTSGSSGGAPSSSVNTAGAATMLE